MSKPRKFVRLKAALTSFERGEARGLSETGVYRVEHVETDGTQGTFYLLCGGAGHYSATLFQEVDRGN